MCWREGLIFEFVIFLEAEIIINIFLSERVFNDIRYWVGTKNGCFVVKLIYYLVLGFFFVVSFFTGYDEVGRAVWMIRVLSKVKIFL